MNLTSEQIYQWLISCSDIFAKQQNYLTELDTVIGDGDHGLNMNRGFHKVAEKLASIPNKDIATILKTTGMTLLSSVGGASGPLFGTFFIRAAQAASGKSELTTRDLADVFKAGVDGVVSRGKAEPSDKTMCDVWWPIADSLSLSAEQGATPADALAAATKAAQQGLESTIPMIARKGRASYLNERSIGHQDPGGTSALLMIEALQQVA